MREFFARRSGDNADLLLSAYYFALKRYRFLKPITFILVQPSADL